MHSGKHCRLLRAKLRAMVREHAARYANMQGPSGATDTENVARKCYPPPKKQGSSHGAPMLKAGEACSWRERQTEDQFNTEFNSEAKQSTDFT